MTASKHVQKEGHCCQPYHRGKINWNQLVSDVVDNLTADLTSNCNDQGGTTEESVLPSEDDVNWDNAWMDNPPQLA